MTNTENDADKGIVHFGGESKEVIEAEDRWHKAIEEIEENETELGRAFASGMKAGRQEMLEKMRGDIKSFCNNYIEEVSGCYDVEIVRDKLLSSLDKSPNSS